MIDINAAYKKNRHLPIIESPYIRFDFLFSWFDHSIEGLNKVGLSIEFGMVIQDRGWYKFAWSASVVSLQRTARQKSKVVCPNLMDITDFRFSKVSSPIKCPGYTCWEFKYQAYVTKKLSFPLKIESSLQTAWHGHEDGWLRPPRRMMPSFPSQVQRLPSDPG